MLEKFGILLRVYCICQKFQDAICLGILFNLLIHLLGVTVHQSQKVNYNTHLQAGDVGVKETWAY